MPTTRRSNRRRFKSATWCGKQCYHWGLKTQHMASGLLIGMDPIGLIKCCLGTRISLKNLMVSSFLSLSMVNISRSTILACGRINGRKPMKCIRRKRGPIRAISPAHTKSRCITIEFKLPIRVKGSIKTEQGVDSYDRLYVSKTVSRQSKVPIPAIVFTHTNSRCTTIDSR